MWDKYLFATSVQHALQLLVEHRGQARIIAGGTDLVLQSQRGERPSRVMVDITRIPGMNFISVWDGYLHIGPLVTHHAVTASPLVQEKAPLLAAACRAVGGPQIRHAGTLVGNVVNAQPAADGAIALVALDAEAEVTRRTGSTWVSVLLLFRGVGVCAADPCQEIVTALRFRPMRASDGWGFQRLARRRALSLPIVVTAAAVSLEGSRISTARIAVGPVAQTPLRPTAAESYLAGRSATLDALAEAARLTAETAQPRDSVLRGSREYRTAMVDVLVRRALSQACRLE